MISGSSKARLGYMCPVDGLRQPRPPPRGSCPGRRPQAPACFKYVISKWLSRCLESWPQICERRGEWWKEHRHILGNNGSKHRQPPKVHLKKHGVSAKNCFPWFCLVNNLWRKICIWSNKSSGFSSASQHQCKSQAHEVATQIYQLFFGWNPPYRPYILTFAYRCNTNKRNLWNEVNIH